MTFILSVERISLPHESDSADFNQTFKKKHFIKGINSNSHVKKPERDFYEAGLHSVDSRTVDSSKKQ